LGTDERLPDDFVAQSAGVSNISAILAEGAQSRNIWCG